MARDRPHKPQGQGIAAALTRAALALPALAAAQEPRVDYQYSAYQEADLPRERLGSGSAERYDIRSHRFLLVAPGSDSRYGVNLTYELMSGASPWYVQPIAGKPIQQMSGASIREERIAAEVSAGRALGRSRVTVTGGVSDEDDYESLSGGVSLERSDEAQLVTWSAGARYSADRLEPTQGAFETGTRRDRRSTLSAYVGVAPVIGERTLLQLGGSASHSEGYLSDPYKQVYVIDRGGGMPGLEFDSRPDERRTWTVSAKLRHHLDSPDAAVHLDYRFYRDDWDLESHTTTLAWHQRFAVDWVLAPSVRYYSQGAAEFYSPWFSEVTADGHMSSDYRLSPFGALALRLDLDGRIGPLGLGLGVEHYDADVRYANGPGNLANPGLVEFMSYRAQVRYRF